MASGDENEFLVKKHIKFFTRCLEVLPGQYASLDTSRMTVAFFAISGLDMMDALHVLDKHGREKYIDWIYSLQVLPNSSGSNLEQCGFRGSATVGNKYNPEEARECGLVYDSGHIAMTYTALLSLLILGDDLQRVNRRGVVAGLRKLQLEDGSFCPTPEGSENDMRFVYCAAAISFILDDWSGVHQDRAVAFITNSISYEGGIGQGPGLEAHGGSNFCALAALSLMGRLEDVFATGSRARSRLAAWGIHRQHSGFQGRPNKPVDTCYSFWVGAALQLLGIYEWTDKKLNRSYLMQTQDPMVGGFAKWPGNSPDPLHTYFGLCGLSLLGEPGVRSMHPALNVSQRAASRLPLNPLSPLSPITLPLSTEGLELERAKHIAFLQQCLRGLPAQHVTADTSRLTVAYFAISGLDLLGALDTIDKQPLIDWIYSLLITPNGNPNTEDCDCGFRGGSSSKTHCHGGGVGDSSHVAMTYSALCCLLILGDTLASLDRARVARCVSRLQREDGSFSASIAAAAAPDMKFSYCAVAVCYMLRHVEAIDACALARYIQCSLSHEGGVGQGPGLEAHGGATYCAVSALHLLGSLDGGGGGGLSEAQRQRIQQWCVGRQHNGFSARTNRAAADSSYSFWIPATLQILGSGELCNAVENRAFLFKCQNSVHGGFAERPGMLSDVMHTYFSLCGLSLCGAEDGLLPIHPALGMSERAAKHLHSTAATWQ